MGTDTPDAGGGRTAARSPKLLVLAIDAAEPALLEQWTADGTMPNVAALMQQGLVGHSRGDEGFFVGATWPSFYTGVNPGRHGIYWLDRLVPGSYRIRSTSPADFLRTPALWDVLSAAGHRVLVCDVPLSYRRSGLNGLQTQEWGVHDAPFAFQTEPPELADELLASFGAHPAPVPCDRNGRTIEEYREFADQLARGAQTRADLTTSLLAREPWDLALQVFSEAHCAGHQLWHFHDPAHPAFDQATTDAAGNLLRDVYAAIDSAIGRIVRTLDEDTTVVVMSLHGMSYIAGAGPLVGDILERLGVLVREQVDEAAPAAPAPVSLRQRAVALAKRAYHLLPRSVRAPLYGARQRVNTQLLDRGTPIDVDPARSRCYPCEMGATVSGIRINLAGRESQGIVAPGADEDAFCAELTGYLLELEDPDTHRKLVHRVFRTKELFHGDRLHELPDLIIEWDLAQANASATVGRGQNATLRAASPRIGVVEYHNRYGRTGEHRIGGMFVARGPGIAAGVLPREASTLDLAPTFAAMVGCRMPDVDGSVIPELVKMGR